MSNYIPVEGNNDLVRDPKTDQIINTNVSAYEQYISHCNWSKLIRDRSLSVEEDLASLKSEMNEIKSLLKELVNGN